MVASRWGSDKQCHVSQLQNRCRFEIRFTRHTTRNSVCIRFTWSIVVHQSQTFPADVIYGQPLDITWPYHVTGSALSVVGPSLSLVRRSRYRTVCVTRRSPATASDNRWKRTYFVAIPLSTHSAVEMLHDSACINLLSTLTHWHSPFEAETEAETCITARLSPSSGLSVLAVATTIPPYLTSSTLVSVLQGKIQRFAYGPTNRIGGSSQNHRFCTNSRLTIRCPICYWFSFNVHRIAASLVHSLTAALDQLRVVASLVRKRYKFNWRSALAARPMLLSTYRRSRFNRLYTR